uniref:ribosomal protein S3 n=1 Tax=Heterosiphonia pulchra TaxID=189631 RepID=UPI002E75FF1A|nr:ribosomal protein S3 [Heterosiphonia pulchra]WQF69551.1 ribosomal protein S3 [Heterosiphonia pulchra]
MSQKINPKSLRLGNSLIWSLINQHYGNKKQNIFCFNYFKTLNLLDSNIKNQILSYFEYQLNSSDFILKIYLKNNVYSIKYNFIFNNISRNIKYLFHNKIKINIRIYSYSIYFYSCKALINYSIYLAKSLNYVPKKIFSTLIYLLTKQLNYKKVYYSKFGPLKLKLYGFKVSLKGRFETSKSQMSKEIKFSHGSLSLVNLNSHIDFLSTDLYTKLGVCNLKIWLFYKTY